MKGDVADTLINAVAGRALQRARQRLGNPRRPISQPAFMRLLNEELGLPKDATPFSQSAFSDWEGGKSTVPAAVLIAAARVVSKRHEPVLIEELVEDRPTVEARLRPIVDGLLQERLLQQGSGPARGGRLSARGAGASRGRTE